MYSSLTIEILVAAQSSAVLSQQIKMATILSSES